MNQRIFNEIQALKRQLLPNEKLILFGSQARGDVREDSDWDLLVLLDKDKKTLEDDDKFAFPFVVMGWENGVYMSTKIYTKKEWESRPSIFRYNVEQEGIVSIEQGKLYRDLFEKRQTGDYDVWISVDERDILPLLEPAEKFIAEIENLVSINF